MENNISKKELEKFNKFFCLDHNMSSTNIEKAKRIYKKEYEHNLELFKQKKLKINFLHKI